MALDFPSTTQGLSITLEEKFIAGSLTGTVLSWVSRQAIQILVKRLLAERDYGESVSVLAVWTVWSACPVWCCESRMWSPSLTCLEFYLQTFIYRCRYTCTSWSTWRLNMSLCWDWGPSWPSWWPWEGPNRCRRYCCGCFTKQILQSSWQWSPRMGSMLLYMASWVTSFLRYRYQLRLDFHETAWGLHWLYNRDHLHRHLKSVLIGVEWKEKVLVFHGLLAWFDIFIIRWMFTNIQIYIIGSPGGHIIYLLGYTSRVRNL